MTALDGGGRDRQPAVAAHAQGAFDCWLEETWEPDDIMQCRREFYQAMPNSPPWWRQRRRRAAARMVNTYQVFFDFDRSNISETAAAIVRQAAANAKQGKLTRIDLTGHTDAAGPVPYNQALSERRAAAVKQELVKDGVPAGEITSVGVGKGGQLVPTADGVREPQNRRTEILLITSSPHRQKILRLRLRMTTNTCHSERSEKSDRSQPASACCPIRKKL